MQNPCSLFSVRSPAGRCRARRRVGKRLRQLSGPLGAHAMSVKYMDRVFESRLAGNEQTVALALADWANDETGAQIFPSVARVARKTKLSERTVQRVVAQLRALGVLEVVERARQHKAVHYRMVLARLIELAMPDELSASGATPPDSGGAKMNSPGVPIEARGDKTQSRGDRARIQGWHSCVTQTVS